jgi:hypothetical protein
MTPSARSLTVDTSKCISLAKYQRLRTYSIESRNSLFINPAYSLRIMVMSYENKQAKIELDLL